MVIFRKEVLEIFKGLFQFRWNYETKFSLSIVISMIPAAFVGYYFEKELSALFDDQTLLVGLMLFVTALLLLLADKAKDTTKNVSFVHAALIGVSQAIAILPGISRSGATISTSVLLGIDRTKAARFSFLMVVPLIVGKMLKDVTDDTFLFSSSELLPLIVGFFAAFISGLLACKWMIALVKRSELTSFAIYCAFYWFDCSNLCFDCMTAQDYLDGKLLLIDKPLGWTSFQAVNKVRWHIKKNLV